MKSLIELLNALQPLIIGLLPVLVIFATWWTNNHSRKVADRQTQELKAHSDENRDLTMQKVTDQVAAATGTHRQLEG